MKQKLTKVFLAGLSAILISFNFHSLIAQELEVNSFPEVIIENHPSDGELTSTLIENLGSFSDSYFLQRIHPNGYYHLVAYSDNGDTVQLHDASKWSIQSSGRKKVLYWVTNDDIFIKPSASCISLHRYVLHNRTINQVVWANLISPPLPMGSNTFRIVNFEPYQSLVLLSNNTVWKVHPNLGSSWKIGQRVIIGVNNHWRTAKHPQIIINADSWSVPFCEAIFYGYPANSLTGI